MLPAHLAVVEVRLRGVYGHKNHVVEVHERLAFPEEALEVDVPDVARVVVARDDHYVFALDARDVLRGLLELFPVSRVGEVAGDHDRGRVRAVDLDYRPVEKVRNKAGVAAMDVAYLAYGQPSVTHA